MKAAKAASSKQDYKTSVSKFSKPAAPVYKSTAAVKANPVFKNVRVRSTDNYSTYSRSRSNYYGSRGWNAPSYAYQSSPSFGMWDGMMLWMMLDNMNDAKYARMAYNQSNDPGMQQWRAEANKLAESNTELKAKLAAMDAKVSGMTGEKDASYMPEGIPAAVVLSSEVLAVANKDIVPFRIATGGQGNNYARTGNLLKKSAESTIAVDVKYTAGTGENLGLFSKGVVDGFIAQNDVMDSMALTSASSVAKMKTKWMVLFQEPVQMISSTRGSVKNIQDLSNDNILYVGPAGSGTESTWNRMKMVDRTYAKIPTANASYADALDIVAKNPKAVMMFVSGLNSGTLTAAEARAEKDDLRLVSIDDSGLLDILDVDGNQLYEETEIPSEVYPKLQKGFFLNKDITTIACKAVFVVNPEWVEKNGEEALTDLTAAATEARGTMNGILARTSEN